jgi:hypothetical protein
MHACIEISFQIEKLLLLHFIDITVFVRASPSAELHRMLWIK